jgi:hypothetical protein
MTTPARRIDKAPFGVVHGSITVMAPLVAMHPPVENPGHKALILSGSVVARLPEDRTVTAGARFSRRTLAYTASGLARTGVG